MTDANKTLIEDLVSDPAGALDFAAAMASVETVALLNRLFEASGITQDELAKRVGVTPGRVSQVLNGDGNFRIATVARFVHALDNQLVLSTKTPIIDGLEARVARRKADPRRNSNQVKS